MENNAIKPIHACEKFFKSGKIQPLIFNFPSFSVDERTFKFFTLDAVEEKFRQIKDSDEKHQNNKLAALVSSQHPNYNSEAQDITKKALTSAFTILSQTKMSELSNSSQSIALSTTSDQLGHLHDKSKFAASLLMIKEGFSDSNYFKRVMESLDLHQDKNLLKEIKGMIASPSMDVIGHIYHIDSKMALEKFPKQSKELLDFAKPIEYKNMKP